MRSKSMSPLAPLSPEALERMTDVYRRAVHELKLDGALRKNATVSPSTFFLLVASTIRIACSTVQCACITG